MALDSTRKAVLVAARCSLRVFPLVVHRSEWGLVAPSKELKVDVAAVAAAAWGAVRFGMDLVLEPELLVRAAQAASDADISLRVTSASAASAAFAAAAAASAFSYASATEACFEAAEAGADANDFGPVSSMETIRQAFQAALLDDIEYVGCTSGHDLKMLHRPLWPDGVPEPIEQEYEKSYAILSQLDRVLVDMHRTALTGDLSPHVATQWLNSWFKLDPTAAPTLQLKASSDFLLGCPETMAEKDFLNRERLTHALVSLLTNREETRPFTIGLFGHWGSGKSSQIELLKMALREAKTENSPRMQFAEFNAWKNEKADNLGAALAQSVVDALTEELRFSERLRLALRLWGRRNKTVSVALKKDIACVKRSFFDGFVWLFPFLSWAIPILVFLGYVIATDNWLNAIVPAVISTSVIQIGSWAFIKANLSNWFKNLSVNHHINKLRLPDYSNHLGLIGEIHKTLHHLCALVLGDLSRIETAPSLNHGSFLLVIVDDLDRCSPKTVKEVFDAVRLVADIPRVITLVAIDERMAFAAVEKHYDQFGDAGRSPSQVTRDYLSKIFHVAVTLPEVGEEAVRSYIDGKLFTERELVVATPSASTISEPAGNSDRVQERANTPNTDKDTVVISTDSVQNEHTRKEAEVWPGQLPTSPRASVNQAKPISRGALLAEKALFETLAMAYCFYNPRLLWRLFQSWKLLKTLAFQGTYDIQQAEPWMRVLFWREWLLQQNGITRSGCEEWLATPPEPEKVKDTRVPDERKLSDCPRDLNQDAARVTEALREMEWDTYLRTIRIVDLVLLPAKNHAFPAPYAESESSSSRVTTEATQG